MSRKTYSVAQIVARIREMAQSLDAVTDADFATLAGVKLSTTRAWRKRGIGGLLADREFGLLPARCLGRVHGCEDARAVGVDGW